MATISFQSVSTTSGTLTKTITLSEADHTRFVEAMKLTFPKTPSTAATALSAWVDWIVRDTQGMIQNVERTQPNPPISTA